MLHKSLVPNLLRTVCAVALTTVMAQGATAANLVMHSELSPHAGGKAIAAMGDGAALRVPVTWRALGEPRFSHDGDFDADAAWRKHAATKNLATVESREGEFPSVPSPGTVDPGDTKSWIAVHVATGMKYEVKLVIGVASTQDCATCSGSSHYPNDFRRVTSDVLGWIDYFKTVALP